MTRTRWRMFSRGAGVTLALGVATAFAWPHAAAWINRERGKSQLEADPQAARDLLRKSLEMWPDDPESHFWSARAARLSDDLDGAERHLADAERHGWNRSLIESERSEQRSIVERVVSDVRTLMAEFRWPEADGAVNRWVELQPRSAKARAAQGQVRERLRKVRMAVESFREATRLDPNDSKTAFDLARLLLELRQSPDEAATILERLNRSDPLVLVHLAAAKEAQGHVAEATGILDDVLKANPKDSKALFLRGRVELNRGNPKSAVGYLRRSTESDPSDREALYLLVVALGSEGTPEEIHTAEERWKRCDADLRRVAELATQVARTPRNAELRLEIGELFLRNGRESDGLRWLVSALEIDPKHRNAHRRLAEHYRSLGQPDLAARHESLANTP